VDASRGKATAPRAVQGVVVRWWGGRRGKVQLAASEAGLWGRGGAGVSPKEEKEGPVAPGGGGGGGRWFAGVGSIGGTKWWRHEVALGKKHQMCPGRGRGFLVGQEETA